MTLHVELARRNQDGTWKTLDVTEIFHPAVAVSFSLDDISDGTPATVCLGRCVEGPAVVKAVERRKGDHCPWKITVEPLWQLPLSVLNGKAGPRDEPVRWTFTLHQVLSSTVFAECEVCKGTGFVGGHSQWSVGGRDLNACSACNQMTRVRLHHPRFRYGSPSSPMLWTHRCLLLGKQESRSQGLEAELRAYFFRTSAWRETDDPPEEWVRRSIDADGMVKAYLATTHLREGTQVVPDILASR